ncbi:hypothetical protein PHSC3_001449 [Chlamydiales bacterium STE3]|nr:hypothetical protein PHSC3_001449 [Chlamydiales bacterium STE3]
MASTLFEMREQSVTWHAIRAIIHQEPCLEKVSFCSYGGRSYSSINAVIYALKLVTDPFLAVCCTAIYLFKVCFYTLSVPIRRNAKTMKMVKVEVFKMADQALFAVFSSALNLVLVGKCFLGILYPRLCYRQATRLERKIFLEFDNYQFRSSLLIKKGIVDSTKGQIHKSVMENMQAIKINSQKVRTIYFKLKLYPY